MHKCIILPMHVTFCATYYHLAQQYVTFHADQAVRAPQGVSLCPQGGDCLCTAGRDGRLSPAALWAPLRAGAVNALWLAACTKRAPSCSLRQEGALRPWRPYVFRKLCRADSCDGSPGEAQRSKFTDVLCSLECSAGQKLIGFPVLLDRAGNDFVRK